MLRVFSSLGRRFSTSSSSRLSLWQSYNNQLEKNPLVTKCITSGVICFAADIICQTGFSDEFKKKLYKDIKIDWVRSFKFTLIGLFYIPTTLHYWYGWLARTIPGTTTAATLKRLALDQLIFAPTFLFGFFSTVLTLDGTPEKIPEKMKHDWIPTVIANYAVWVPGQFINFKLVPPQYQVLWANVVGFFWNIYLSYASYNTGDKNLIENKKEADI